MQIELSKVANVTESLSLLIFSSAPDPLSSAPDPLGLDPDLK
jgi:hypothetical protein